MEQKNSNKLKLWIIDGPNINLVGKTRDPKTYGKLEVEKFIDKLKQVFGEEVEIQYFQTNSEGKIIDLLHEAQQKQIDGIVLNPGAYSHYSYAIMDAIEAIKIPVIEVHISNIFAREDFRQNLVTAKAAMGVIAGLGVHSYEIALMYLKFVLQDIKK